jgi:hypothetical protein
MVIFGCGILYFVKAQFISQFKPQLHRQHYK